MSQLFIGAFVGWGLSVVSMVFILFHMAWKCDNKCTPSASWSMLFDIPENKLMGGPFPKEGVANSRYAI